MRLIVLRGDQKVLVPPKRKVASHLPCTRISDARPTSDPPLRVQRAMTWGFGAVGSRQKAGS